MNNSRKEKKPPQAAPKKKATKPSSVSLDDLCRQVRETDEERIVFEWNGQWYALLTMEELEYLEDIEEEFNYDAVQGALEGMDDGASPTLFQIESLPNDKEKH